MIQEQLCGLCKTSDAAEDRQGPIKCEGVYTLVVSLLVPLCGCGVQSLCVGDQDQVIGSGRRTSEKPTLRRHATTKPPRQLGDLDFKLTAGQNCSMYSQFDAKQLCKHVS